MSIQQKISDLLKKSSIGICIEQNINGSIALSALEIDIHNNDLSIKVVFEDEDRLENFLDNISNSVPIYVVLNGKGVLNKILANNLKEKKEQVNSILPEANSEDFYLQQYSLTNELKSISLIRKKAIDLVVETLLEHNKNISDVIIGNEILCNIYNLYNNGTSQIKGIGQILHFNDDHLFDVELSDLENQQILEVDGYNLNIRQQLAFAASIEHFSRDTSLEKINIDKVIQSKLKKHTKKMYKIAAICSTLVAFSILMVNTFLFIYLSNEVNKLESSLEINKGYLEEAKDLSNDLESKRIAFSKVKTNEYDVSYYSDRIASIIPPGLLLNTLVIYPAEKHLKKIEFETFDASRIDISGLSNETSELHEFIRLLTSLKWIEKVSLTSLDKVNKSHFSQFHLSLKLKQ